MVSERRCDAAIVPMNESVVLAVFRRIITCRRDLPTTSIRSPVAPRFFGLLGRLFVLLQRFTDQVFQANPSKTLRRDLLVGILDLKRIEFTGNNRLEELIV